MKSETAEQIHSAIAQAKLDNRVRSRGGEPSGPPRNWRMETRTFLNQSLQSLTKTVFDLSRAEANLAAEKRNLRSRLAQLEKYHNEAEREREQARETINAILDATNPQPEPAES
jgi:hypothetical protein